jgi:hypothetical protein
METPVASSSSARVTIFRRDHRGSAAGVSAAAVTPSSRPVSIWTV